jgi:nitrate/nitrite transport system ATP-binding protein
MILAAQRKPVAAPLKAPVALELRDVSKSYGTTHVLAGVDLAITEGEFVAIVGFSGSGKSTLVNLFAGLAAPDAGEVLKGGRPVGGPGRDRGGVFQGYSLIPWMSVWDNVAVAVQGAERDARTERYVRMVGLAAAAHKRPAELSGGMRQRVAVARALAANPDVLLLDEPLSALDALTRAKLQDELTRICGEEKKTVLLITNDVDEALILADRIIPLDPGPRAALGPSFQVDLPRPRDRRALNHDARFKELRRDITQYLIDAGERRGAQRDAKVIRLPGLQPRVWLGAPRSEKFGDERFAEFTQLGKVYPVPGGSQKVVDGFELKIAKGEFISIIGHSGCGKSTVLSMVAGLTDISEGGVILDGREIAGAGPDRGVVFQAPSLVPWLTAYENVALGVASVYPHATPAERRDTAEYYLGRVGLADALHKRAAELSGGMKQRVGIARAFALAPKLLLLDEPFGMLDSLTRWELQEVLMEVWAKNRITAVVVTHDVDEAILLADRVVMMTNGPHAKVGQVMPVPLPRPRSRRALLAHPQYYELRENLIGFLETCAHA